MLKSINKEFTKKYNAIAGQLGQGAHWHNTHYIAITSNDELKLAQLKQVVKNFVSALGLYVKSSDLIEILKIEDFYRKQVWTTINHGISNQHDINTIMASLNAGFGAGWCAANKDNMQKYTDMINIMNQLLENK